MDGTTYRIQKAIIWSKMLSHSAVCAVHAVESEEDVLSMLFTGKPAAAVAGISLLETSIPDEPPPHLTGLIAIDSCGMVVLSWDGRDEAGRPAASCAFRSRLRWACGVASGRVLLAK